jgi:hypothetical protein
MMVLIPERLPSLVLLVGFWIPPMVIGWAAAGYFHRSAVRVRAALPYALLTTFILGWSAAWFLFQLNRMPPYIPGASEDPTFAPPQAVTGLAVVASALVLPVSLLACVLAFQWHRRALRRSTTAHKTNFQG